MNTRTTLLVLVLVWAFLSAGRPGAAFPSPFDVESYDWSVTLTFAENLDEDSSWRPLISPLNTLSAEARITVGNAGATALEEIPLLLHRLMKPEAVLVNGQPQSWEDELVGLRGREAQQVRHVRVHLSTPVPPGESFELDIRYGGQMTGYPEAGMLYVRETLDPDFTILRWETFCYPQIAQPTEEAADWAVRHDAFDQTLQVSVPEGHVAVNGGQLSSRRTEHGMTTYSYRSLEPDTSIQIAIAPYRSLERDGHRIFYFVSSEEGANRLAQAMGQGLAWLSERFGPLPGDRRLKLVEIPDFFGSQAGAMVIQTSAAFNDPESVSELYHELTHFWNPRDVDDRPCRWNEGLATYLEALMEEEIGGEPRLDAALEDSLRRLEDALSRHPDARGVPMREFGSKDLTDLSYSAGSLFFGLLGDRVGRDELLAFLARWSREHRADGSSDVLFADALASAWGGAASDIVERFFRTGAYTDDVAELTSWAKLRERYAEVE